MPQNAIASIPVQTTTAPPPLAAAPAAASSGPTSSANRGGFTFHDFFNIINPLQHIPVVSTIYRELTGDKIKPISNILGGALFGGVIGLAGAAIDSIVEETTGEDIGAHVMATLGLHHDRTADGTQVATAAQGAPIQSNTVLSGAIQDNTVRNGAIQGGGAPTGGRATGAVSPVPAFLVQEAAADRAAHGLAGQPGQPGPVAPGPAAGAPTDFWRSLQRGGSGVTHSGSGRAPISIAPPKALLDYGSPQGNARPASPASAGQPAPAQAAPQAPAPGAAPSVPGAGPSVPVAAATAPSPVLASAASTGSQFVSSSVAQGAAQNGAPNGVPGAALPPGAFAQKMMDALAKYQAMQKSGRIGTAAETQTVDRVD